MSNADQPLPTQLATEVCIPTDQGDSIDGLWLCPPGVRAVLVLAHGAGAGMQHRFMDSVAAELAQRSIATLRYQFPYMQAGKKRPDRAPVLEQTVRAAIAFGREQAGDLPLLAGGKSMGGRMTSRALAERSEPRVRGLVFLGFPLHAAGKPGTERADHLRDVGLPMLFAQGTRDSLADLELLGPVIDQLPAADLAIIDGADHSFHVLKRSGRTDAEAMTELCDRIAAFVEYCG